MLLRCLRTIHITFFIVHLQWKFGVALCLFFFLKFRTVATVSGGTVATVVTFFFSVFRMYYIYIYCYIDTTNFTIFLPLLKCQFLLSQNKIIKYETVTNHN